MRVAVRVLHSCAFIGSATGTQESPEDHLCEAASYDVEVVCWIIWDLSGDDEVVY